MLWGPSDVCKGSVELPALAAARDARLGTWLAVARDPMFNLTFKQPRRTHWRVGCGLAFLSRVTGQLGAPLRKASCLEFAQNAAGWWSGGPGVTHRGLRALCSPGHLGGRCAPSAHRNQQHRDPCPLPGQWGPQHPGGRAGVDGAGADQARDGAGANRAPLCPPPAPGDSRPWSTPPVADPGMASGARRRARCSPRTSPTSWRPPGGREAV